MDTFTSKWIGAKHSQAPHDELLDLLLLITWQDMPRSHSKAVAEDPTTLSGKVLCNTSIRANEWLGAEKL
jgi:hypothetical protein